MSDPTNEAGHSKVWTCNFSVQKKVAAHKRVTQKDAGLLYFEDHRYNGRVSFLSQKDSTSV